MNDSTNEPTNVPKDTQPEKGGLSAKLSALTNKQKVLFIAIPGIVLIFVIVVLLSLPGKDKNRQMSSSNPDGNSNNSQDTKGGNKADASGLVAARDLECVPRGHDNYRTDSTLAVDQNDANVAYVGVEYKGVFKTTDGGATWKQSDYGIRGYPREGDAKQKCIQEMGRILIDPKDSKHVLMSRVESPGDITTLFSENAGLWESKDAGATWKQLVKDKMNASGSRAIAFDPKDSKVMYYGVNNMLPSYDFGTNKHTEYYNKIGIIYKTTDGGITWTELPTGAEHGFRAVNMYVGNNDPSLLWLFAFTEDQTNGSSSDESQKGPMKSTDGGKTWKAYGAAFPTGYKSVVDGKVNPVDSNNAFVPTQNMTSQQRSFVTTDGGTTWKQSSTFIYVAAYDTTDKTGNRVIGYNPFEGKGGIYESLDKGVTWNLLSAVPPEVNNSDKLGVRIEGFGFSNSAKGTVYMSGSNAYVWKSTDGGKTWKTVMDISKIGGKNKNKEGSEKSREQDPGAH